MASGYEVGERLSVGQRSVVHRARRRDDGAAVVLKTLLEGRAGVEARAQLAREYELMRAVADDGVLRPIALERAGDDVSLVVEDFGGTSLRALAARERFGLAAVLEIGARIAAALGAVHRQGIIHKDVNPSNVVMNPETGALKLIDFGIATRLTRESLGVRSVEHLEGTLAYISPEQTGRMNRAVDSRTDLYSLGATLYELLLGEPPFRGADAVEVVHGHIAVPPTAPHLRDPAIPLGVSRVVMKLLAKAAEDRYQSAWGLRADLERCLHALRTLGTVPDFEPGDGDVPDRFVIPQRLYGRERELAMLMGTFARVADGAAELLLVSGYAGVGKSALVHEVHRPITRARGHFAAGKFDQYHRDVPYSALIQCLGDLLRQVLSEREEVLDRWRARLSEALGANGAVLTDMIPELALVVGPQPPVEPLAPAESQNRWNLVFLRFLRCLAAAEHPLVLFLDDLQWADSPSLKLLQHVVTDGETRHLLVIGAYRDNEVDAAHPLALTLDALRRAGAAPTLMALGPLDLAHVEALVTDALRAPPGPASELAALALQKTHGNPFFLGQFLKEAADAGLLRYDADARGWTWDIAQIRAQAITDNVVDLMAAK
ncbi:MAG: AAA family ATPase, partial [Polyangiales bacterium]